MFILLDKKRMSLPRADGHGQHAASRGIATKTGYGLPCLKLPSPVDAKREGRGLFGLHGGIGILSAPPFVPVGRSGRAAGRGRARSSRRRGMVITANRIREQVHE